MTLHCYLKETKYLNSYCPDCPYRDMRSFKHTNIDTFSMCIEIYIVSFQLLKCLTCCGIYLYIQIEWAFRITSFVVPPSLSLSVCLSIHLLIFVIFSSNFLKLPDKFHKKMVQSRGIRILIVNMKDKPILQREILVIIEHFKRAVVLKITLKKPHCIRNVDVLNTNKLWHLFKTTF